MARLRIGAAQLDLVVGDLDGNVTRVLAAYERATAAGCDVVAFPELAVTGYPPEDLLLRPSFVEAAVAALDKIATRTSAAAAIIGFPERHDGALYNSAAVAVDGRVVGVYRKHLLPNFAVFDEERYFEPWAADGPLFSIAGVRVGCSICEDAWSPTGPILSQSRGGADLVVNINASPYYAGRVREREVMLSTRAIDAGVPIVYVNLVGGQDELVFDGASMVIDERGTVMARARSFREDLLVVDLDVPVGQRALSLPEIQVSPVRFADPPVAPRVEPVLGPVHEVYEALVLGTRDYVDKNGFEHVLLGLSGGVDSALVATIATDALGAERVTGVLLPSRFSSEGSVGDAETLAANLGIATRTIPIESAHQALLEMLAPAFVGTEPGIAEENLQARIRGTLVMALANKFGWIVLTTGNKSEFATGYSTLYGDMAGGFSVIKDVPKSLVYALARDRNERAGRDLIPDAILDKPPSAELRPDQKDSDSLPDYAVLDAILEGYVERDRSVAELVADGFDEATVRRVARLVDRNEYKRRQSPPGIRVSPKAFGKDRRLPITNAWPG
jgi:NAD+ synthase (glutamine-hydrolysing)